MTVVKQAAAGLGIQADAVYNWLRHGQAPARLGSSGRWCIPWDPATQEIYRQKVANSVRLNPIPLAPRSPGAWSAAQAYASASLSVS